MIKEKMFKKLKFFGHKVCGIILTAALAIGSLTVIPGGVQAKADDSKGEKIYNDIMSMTNGEPAGYNNSTNPYGYAYDEPFFMYRPQNLAAYFNYGQHEKVSYKQYNLKGRGQYEGYFYDAAHDDYGDKGDEDWRMGYVRTVAFDPTGSGRKTWLACVGIYYGDDIWFWFYNEDGQRSKSYRLGSANWMGDSNTAASKNTKYFNSMNFISITAGDYNKDKCDSVVIYACYNHSSYSVNEITVNPEDMTCNADKAGVLDDYHHLLNEAYVNNDTIRELLSDSDNNDYIGNHLSCQLATGDVNGDGIDDLVAVSAPCRMDSKGLAWQNYAACVKVCLGSKGRARFISQDWTGYRFVHDEADGNDISCVAPGVSIGDIDGDGINEIVVAGIKNTIKSNSPFNVDESKMIIAAYEYDTSINRDGYGAKRLREEDYKEVDTNAWTKGGTDGSDNAWQVTAVECVAFEGKASPEKVFVSGDVYQWIGGSGLTKETTFNYFTEDDDGSGSTILSNTFINSVAAGNFDGNTWGYEQIVYVVGLKKQSYDEYKFTEGWGGRKYDTSTGELKEGYFSTSLSTMENHTWPDDFAYADLEDREGLNYIICPIDTKDDGILARYKGKTYTYADPQVMAIIQAAPTFGELDNIDGNYNGLNGSGSTSVSVSVSNTYGNSVGNSLSAGLGLNVSLETSVVEVNTRIGANFSWDREFSDSISDSKTYTFVAQDEDVVAVARVPVVLYTYELQVNGKWDNNFRAKSGRLTYSDQDKKENAIVLSFPQNPVYQTITLDDYNDFVKCYNKKLEDEFAAKKAAGKVSADYEPTYLTAIEDKWLGNEGNPYAYRSVNELSDDFVILQDSPVALSNTSGYTEYTTSSADTHSESDSISYGFSFELEVLAGCNVGGNGAKAGYDLALEYMTTRSSFKETTKETSYTGQVPNIVSSEAEKLPYVGTEQASRNYKFTWQLAKWDSNIVDQVADMNGNKKPETIPVIGYALSNISAPTLRVADLKTEKIDDSGKPAVRLTWSKPVDADRTTVGGYSLYQYQADGTRVKIADLPGDATEYLFDSFDGKDTYKFTISTKEGIDDTYESLESLFAYAYMFDGHGWISSIVKSGTSNNVDTYVIYFSDGTTSDFTVTNGLDGVPGVKGADGAGISSVDYMYTDGQNMYYRINFTDGSTYDLVTVNGKNGNDGVSAYEVAVNNGFTGTEVEWLESLKGKDGVDGRDGVDGTNGANGLSAYDIAVKNGFVGTETEWLESLRGKDGRNGIDGINGKDGKDGVNGQNASGVTTSPTLVTGQTVTGTSGSVEVISISGVELKPNGDLVVTMSDGNEKVAGNILSTLDVDAYLKAKGIETGADASEHTNADDPDDDDADDNDDNTAPVVEKVSFSKISRPSSIAKALTLKWSKAADVDGYEIRYSLKKDFSKSKTVVVEAVNTKKTYQKLTVKNLKGAHTYYVQIRAYVDEDGNRYYSDWSDTVSKKTAKKVTVKTK